MVSLPLDEFAARIRRADRDPHTLDAPALAARLAALPPLAATELACECALSTSPSCRLALARALQWIFRLCGDASVIDHLACDEDPVIRLAAARAALARHATGVYGRVIDRLLLDPDVAVREIAMIAKRNEQRSQR